MANEIEWYVVELKRRLSGRLPLRKLLAVCDEAKDHLESSKQDFIERGQDPQVAETSAVLAFGNHDVLCDRLLAKSCKETFGLDTERLILFWMLGLGSIYPIYHFAFDGANMVGASMYLGLGMLLVAFILFFRTWRLQWKAIVGCVVLFNVVVTAYSIPDSIWSEETGNNYSMRNLKSNLPQMRELVKEFSDSERFFKEGVAAFAKGTAESDPRFFVPGRGYRVPLREAEQNAIPLFMGMEEQESRAVALWNLYGQSHIESASKARDYYGKSLRGSLALIEQGPVGISQKIERVHLILLEAGVEAGILLVLNWIAMNVARLFRRTMSRLAALA